MRAFILLVVLLLLSPLAHAELREVALPSGLIGKAWSDDASASSLLLVRLPKAQEIQNVRDQSAGFIEGPVLSGYFIPTSAGAVSFGGLPALQMRGCMRKDGRSLNAVYTIAFATECTFMVTAASAGDPSSREAEAEVEKTAKPLLGAQAIMQEVGPKISAGILELGALAEKIMAEQARKNKALDNQSKAPPATTSTAAAAETEATQKR
ncbi:MAG: hypothetical protein QM790_04315 [Nibricoccus sp.]